MLGHDETWPVGGATRLFTDGSSIESEMRSDPELSSVNAQKWKVPFYPMNFHARRKTREPSCPLGDINVSDAMMYMASVIYNSDRGVDLSIDIILSILADRAPRCGSPDPIEKTGWSDCNRSFEGKDDMFVRKLGALPSINIMGDRHSPRTKMSTETMNTW